MDSSHMLRIVGVGFALVLVVLAVLSYTILRQSDEADERQDRQAAYTAKERARVDKVFRAGQYQACTRGNDVRAYLRQDAYRNASDPIQRGLVADAEFPILDCAPFLAGRIGKALPKAEQVVVIREKYPNYKPGGG